MKLCLVAFTILSFTDLVLGQEVEQTKWREFISSSHNFSFEYPEKFDFSTTLIDFGECAGSVQFSNSYQSSYQVYDDPGLGSDEIQIDHATEYEIHLYTGSEEAALANDQVLLKNGGWFLISNYSMIALSEKQIGQLTSLHAVGTYAISSGKERELYLIEKELGSCKAVLLMWLYAVEPAAADHNRIVDSLRLIKR